MEQQGRRTAGGGGAAGQGVSDWGAARWETEGCGAARDGEQEGGVE